MTQKQLRKWGLFLVLVIPGVGCLWLLFSIIFFVGGGGGMDYGGTADIIRSLINWLLGVIALLGILVALPVGIVFLVKGYKTQSHGSQSHGSQSHGTKDSVYIAKKR